MCREDNGEERKDEEGNGREDRHLQDAFMTHSRDRGCRSGGRLCVQV